MKKILVLLIFFFSVVTNIFALEIDRQKILFSKERKREVVTIRNNSQQKIDVKVFSEGQCKTKIFPRLFSLNPDESQSVKIFLEKYENNACRLYISEKPSLIENTEEASSDTSARMSIAISLSIPVLYEEK